MQIKKYQDECIKKAHIDGFVKTMFGRIRTITELENKNTNGNDPLDYSFIVPVKTVNELSRLLDDDDEALTQIFVTRKHIVFLIGELTFFSRLIEGEFLNYKDAVPKNFSTQMIIDKNEDFASFL